MSTDSTFDFESDRRFPHHLDRYVILVDAYVDDRNYSYLLDFNVPSIVYDHPWTKIEIEMQPKSVCVSGACL